MALIALIIIVSVLFLGFKIAGILGILLVLGLIVLCG